MADKFDIEREIVQRAMKDLKFKQKLFTHPAEAIKEITNGFGVDPKLIDTLKIKVNQDAPGEWNINVSSLDGTERQVGANCQCK